MHTSMGTTACAGVVSGYIHLARPIPQCNSPTNASCSCCGSHIPPASQPHRRHRRVAPSTALTLLASNHSPSIVRSQCSHPLASSHSCDLVNHSSSSNGQAWDHTMSLRDQIATLPAQSLVGITVVHMACKQHIQIVDLHSRPHLRSTSTMPLVRS